MQLLPRSGWQKIQEMLRSGEVRVKNAQDHSNLTLPFFPRFGGEQCISKGFMLKQHSTKTIP